MKNEIKNKVLAALAVWVSLVALIYGATAFVLAEPNAFNWERNHRLGVVMLSALCFLLVLLGLIHWLEELKSQKCDTRNYVQ